MKASPVRLRALARLDVERAIDHYLAEAGDSVAAGFVDALQQGLAHISRHPATGSPRYGHELGIEGLRSWPLGRYPFIVFYVERADHLDVWRVLHERRDIPGWMGGEPRS